MLQYGADRSVAEAHYEGIAAHVDFLARQAGYGDGVPQFGAWQRSLFFFSSKRFLRETISSFKKQDRLGIYRCENSQTNHDENL